MPSPTEEGGKERRDERTTVGRGRREGSQCINNITSSEAGSPPSKPTSHLPGERATDSGPFSLEIRACRRRRRRVTACHFDCPARQVCRCGSSEGVAEGEGGSEEGRREGERGLPPTGTRPRPRPPRGSEEGRRESEGGNEWPASCLFSALPQPVLASAPTPSSLPKAEGKEGRREEEEGEASGKLF